MFTYIASPYTPLDKTLSDEEKVAYMQRRFFEVAVYTHKEVKAGEPAFSPIIHGHTLHKLMPGLPTTWEFWWVVDGALLRQAKMLDVLRLLGWQESVGVQTEIKEAKKIGMPIQYSSLPNYLVTMVDALMLRWMRDSNARRLYP